MSPAGRVPRFAISTAIMKTSSFPRAKRSLNRAANVCRRPGSVSPSNFENSLDRVGEATTSDVRKGGLPNLNTIRLNRGRGERGGLRSPEERRRRVSIP
jgi:hypothetical protein